MKELEEIIQTKGLEEIVRHNSEQFEKEFSQRPTITAVAPGRINIIGEHTDYNQGLAMPVAINRWVIVSFSPSDSGLIHIKSLNYDSELRFKIGEHPQINESWQKYVMGAIEIFRREYPMTTGFNALIWGNVPIGSGVSSSAAIEVAVMNGLRQLYNARFSDLALIKYCQQIEHEYLKVNSGLLDQYASQFSRIGKIMVLDFMSLSHEYINADMNGWSWILVDSKVKRELSKSKYSDRVAETQSAFNYLHDARVGVHTFRDIRLDQIDLIPNQVWKKRIRHYITENQRVINSMEHIANCNFIALGEELKKSHDSLSHDYEVSCPELDFLAAKANEFQGCAGSRMMGGGFGGCTINLVRSQQAQEFKDFISKEYNKQFHIQPEVNEYAMVEGARILT